MHGLPNLTGYIMLWFSQTGDHTTHISARNSTLEGTPYHSNTENHTAPFETDAESHLGAPIPQHHIHVYHCHSTLTGTASYWRQPLFY